MGNIVPYIRAETLTEADREYLRTQTLSTKATQYLVEAEPGNVSYLDTTNWGAATLTHTYDVGTLIGVVDATQYAWEFRDASDNYSKKGGSIEVLSATSVRVSFEIEPGASNYQLLGLRQ